MLILGIAEWTTARQESELARSRRHARGGLVNQGLIRGLSVKPNAVISLMFSMLAHAALAGNNDVNGWQDTKWGMTPDEVQKAIGRPMSFADLAKVCDKTCDEGAALELHDYGLNNQHFVVRLWFSKPDTRLHTVSMYEKKSDENIDSQSFQKMKTFLESIYGAPRSVSLRRGYFTVVWEMPSTKISLYSNAADQTTIVYEPPTDGETEKQ
jgi:hypothetical protein